MFYSSIKNSLRVALSLALFATISCSKDKPNSEPDAGKKVYSRFPAGSTRYMPADFAKTEISTHTYRLLQDLEFESADIEDQTLFEGTSLENAVRLLSMTFIDQARVDSTDLDPNASSCAVVYEAQKSTRLSEINFSQNNILAPGQFVFSSRNDSFAFALQLTAGTRQSFYLECRNVKNLAQIQRHIGHLLE